MPVKIDHKLTPQRLLDKINRVFDLSALKILSLEKAWDSSKGTPVFTVKGKYASRGWTEWTQGFQFGMAFLQFDATDEVGMLHLALAFILGAINEWHHSRKHAYAKLSWLGIEISGFLMIAGFMYGMFPFLTWPSVGLFIISVVGLVMTEGGMATVEIPGLLSNVMSYLRLAAVGVGAVILAEAINDLLLPKLDFSPVGFVVFLLTLVLWLLGHFMAILLGMLESLIHGARLNVVEFFGKFFKGNGLKFLPFAAHRIHTQEA